MTYKEARERMDRHIEKSTATRGYDGDKAAAWGEIKLLKELLKGDINESKEDEKMKYSVVERKIKTGEEWVMFEENDLEEAKAEARDFAYINKRDNNGNEIMLVVTGEWEEGNYSPIEYAEKEENEMKIYTADKETGTFIEECASIKEALTKIEKYEQEDREEGTYEEDFYDIVNEEHQTIAQEENKVKFMVNFYDPETGATSPIDNIEESADYTAEQYIEDCKSNADDEWNAMLASGTVTLVEVDE